MFSVYLYVISTKLYIKLLCISQISFCLYGKNVWEGGRTVNLYSKPHYMTLMPAWVFCRYKCLLILNLNRNVEVLTV
jgi:hypothetical protein